MAKPIAVFLDRASIDLNDLDLEPLQSDDFSWQFYDHTAPEEIAERICEATLVISNKVKLDQSLIQQAKQLKLICVAATGVNNIDIAAAKAAGITVTNTPAYGTPSVVQHVFTLILALSTNLTQYQTAVKNGGWSKSPMFCLLDYPITEISGKRLGIVGHGELGRGVAKVADAFGLEVLIAQRPGGTPQAGRIPLHDLLPQVDILSLHCPLNENTAGLIGHHELALMKADALLINTARGGIVDEAALAQALKQQQIGGAGFDVLSTEPPQPENPLLECSSPNLIVTPHCAWGSRESRQRLINIVAKNIQAYQKGEAINCVEG